MAYRPPEYSGLPSEDLEEHIYQYKLFLGGSGIGNDYAGKIRALNIWLVGLKGPARDFYDNKLAEKNWELHHVAFTVNVANIAATGAVSVLPNMPGIQALLNAGGAGVGISASLINAAPQLTFTGAQTIPVDNFHIDQNWSY